MSSSYIWTLPGLCSLVYMLPRELAHKKRLQTCTSPGLIVGSLRYIVLIVALNNASLNYHMWYDSSSEIVEKQRIKLFY